MGNWSRFEGVKELTFKGLKHALENVSRNAFVCVWTDAIGDDTNNETLKDEILDLKNSTQSEIFIMAITGSIEPGRQNREAPGADDTSKTDRSAIGNQNGGEDGRDRQARVSMPKFEDVFRDIGYVMDVMDGQNVIGRMIDIMKDSALCNKNTTTTTKTPTTP